MPVSALDPVRDRVEEITGAIREVSPMGGGCIATAMRVEGERAVVFVKTAGGEAGATFEAEATGLRALGKAARLTGLIVPEPLLAMNASANVPGLLVMDWVEPGRPSSKAWEVLGRGLAALHRAEALQADGARYGFVTDNAIGRLPQSNTRHERWPDFFREERLIPQIRMARDRGRWREAWTPLAETLLTRLDALLPEAPSPATLHGDLWSGNALATANGTFALVDPAVYIGHRETDLAMSRLFGGFSDVFYSAYEEAWPTEAEGRPEREAVYNLYHLINHLSQFGAGYAGRVEAVLKRFG